jgi:hypothetical protein
MDGLNRPNWLLKVSPDRNDTNTGPSQNDYPLGPSNESRPPPKGILCVTFH